MATLYPSKLELPQSNFGSGMIMKAEIDFESILPSLNQHSSLSISAPASVKVLLQPCAKSMTINPDNSLTAAHLGATTSVHTIIIPSGATITDPIVIRSTSNLPIQSESILIVAEEGSKADIIQLEESEENATFKSQIIEVQVHPNAAVRYSTLINHNTNHKINDFSIKQASVGEDASIEWVDLRMGGHFSRSETKSILEQRGAQAACWNIYYGTDSQQFDICSSSVHKAANTNAQLRARAVLQDSAKAMYRGNININKHASQCVSQQKSETLLLGDQARCNALPILQVENDDVICSHGAAMGQLSDLDLFYLCSRGVDEQDARQLLIESFLNVGIAQIPSSDYQQKCISWLRTRALP